MQAHYLKASDEASLLTSLVLAGLLIQSEEALIPASGVNLDIIGTITKPTGTVQIIDGTEVPEMVSLDGYHANLLADLTPEQQEALASVLLPAPPTNPVRVWAS